MQVKITDADTPTVRLGATPSGLTSAYLHHPPYFKNNIAHQQESVARSILLLLFFKNLSSLGGGECSFEVDCIPSLQCHRELLKQKTGFYGITGNVADASANVLNQFSCLLVPRAGCFNSHWVEGMHMSLCDRSLYCSIS